MKTYYWSRAPGRITDRETGKDRKRTKKEEENMYITIGEWYQTLTDLICEQLSDGGDAGNVKLCFSTDVGATMIGGYYDHRLDEHKNYSGYKNVSSFPLDITFIGSRSCEVSKGFEALCEIDYTLDRNLIAVHVNNKPAFNIEILDMGSL